MWLSKFYQSKTSMMTSSESFSERYVNKHLFWIANSHVITLKQLWNSQSCEGCNNETCASPKCCSIHGCCHGPNSFVYSNRIFAKVKAHCIMMFVFILNVCITELLMFFFILFFWDRGSLFRLIHRPASGELLDHRRRLRMALDVVCDFFSFCFLIF